MKIKSIVLDTIIILINLGIIFTTVYEGFEDLVTDRRVSGLLGAFVGFQLAQLFKYWGMKFSRFGMSHIDKEKAMETWQYITLVFSIVALMFQSLYINHTFENLKPAALFVFAWMIVTGNFRANIDPILETLSVYTDDEDIRRKTQRFSGKLSFFCGIMGAFLILVLPQNYVFCVCVSFYVLSIILPEFYAKIIFSKKYA